MGACLKEVHKMIEITKKYYVYAHILNGDIVYIGKGSGTRYAAIKGERCRSKKWKSIVKDSPFTLEVYGTAKEASEIIGCHKQTVTSVCNGDKQAIKGLKLEYINP